VLFRRLAQAEPKHDIVASLSTLGTLDDEGVYLLLTKLIAELGPIDVPFGRPAPGRAPPFIERLKINQTIA
jgi:hypothetical protein